MPFTLLGAVVLGLATAGALTAVFHLMGRRVPRWILPTGAAIAVLAYIVWSDYTWYARTAGALPPRIEVATTHGSTNPIRPWTLIKAPVERFIAVDRGSVRTNPKTPGYVMAKVYLLARYLPTAEVVQLYDCGQPRRTDLGASTAFGPDGLPRDAAWVPVAADDAVRRMLCAAREARERPEWRAGRQGMPA